jgi:energy-coupling factor transporter ATP-binding protein EcfA2
MGQRHWPRGREADSATIDEIRFRHFKAFPDFVVPLGETNILVGPNNSGKSTVVGALRALAAGLQTARSRKPDPLRPYQPGYRVPEEGIPISLENARTDFERQGEAQVRFLLSNGNRLTLRFPDDGGCVLIPEIDGPPVGDAADFKRAFPVSVAHVPVLGPVEHDEPLVQRATVLRGLSTHRASRQFRSYWWYERERFDGFRSMLRRTWRGFDIRPPDLVPAGADTTVVMWCVEDGYPRELYWAGSGFQVWCQLLTHIERARDASVLVIDEPEIYLHPDVQRQLLSLLRSYGPAVVIATHSTELIAEAEPTDLLLIDKRKTTARRVANAEGVSAALDAVGSVHNAVFTQIARTHRVVLVEGGDFGLLGRFARKLRLDDLAGRRDFAVVATNGFPDPGALRVFTNGMAAAVGATVHAAGVFDRDYRSTAEVTAVLSDLQATLTTCYVLGRKEIENYLLVPAAVQRAVEAAVLKRRARGLSAAEPSVLDILDRVTATMATDVRDRFVATLIDHPEAKGLATVTKTRRANEAFDQAWASLEGRLEICPGKRVLSELNRRLQAEAQVSVTTSAIVTAMRANEVPSEMRAILRGLDRFRQRPFDA